MSAIEQKLITFLTRNAHLDCEIPDIAFHLKLDEQLVQKTLNELYEKGVVTAHQNQYGRAFWYFVPQRSSIPFETMSSPQLPEELSEMEARLSGKSKGSNKIALTALIFSILSILSIVGAVIWVDYTAKLRLEAVQTEMQTLLKQEKFVTVIETTENRFIKIENALKKTMVTVDSLKIVVEKLENN